ncbi:MAG: hypothetical protein AAB320_05075 [Elusimicrobiota bacterium]
MKNNAVAAAAALKSRPVDMPLIVGLEKHIFLLLFLSNLGYAHLWITCE